MTDLSTLTPKARRRTKYIAPPVMADTIWRSIEAALMSLENCHERYADCHSSNHAKWERIALMRLRMAIASMLAELETPNA